jgi:cytochrome c peroxidase
MKGESEARGEDAFKHAGCRSCHSGPYYTNGEVIPLDVIGTDPARARQEFPKGYRVPTLRRLDLVRLFLHDGSVGSLADMFSRGRLASSPGHEYGLDLSEEEKKDLVAFLLSL